MERLVNKLKIKFALLVLHGVELITGDYRTYAAVVCLGVVRAPAEVGVGRRIYIYIYILEVRGMHSV